MHKTLLEDWRCYTKHLTSPDSFIDMSFYFMIGSALQRRVWLGPCHMPIFANMYVILVGDPGVGKGITIKPITNLIKYHRQTPVNQQLVAQQDIVPSGMDVLSPERAEMIKEYITSIETLQKMRGHKKHYMKEDPLLFPVPADATTYESLVEANAHSNRFFKCPPEMKERYKKLVPPSGIYSHSSLCFLLEELSSLFRKHAEDLVKYLLVAWDCGDYTYATKHQGVDKVKNLCLSMLGGTTPGFMRDSYNEKLLDEGFSARALFIFEKEPRFHLFGIPDLDQDQLIAEANILARLKQLSTLFGQCFYTPEAEVFLKYYFEKELPQNKVNSSVKLMHYYGKKNMHVQKLILARHFADSNEMVIGIEPVKKVLMELEKLEVNMHFALSSGGKNIHGIAGKKILKFLESCRQPQSMYDIWKELEGDIKDTELQEVLKFLISTEQIEHCRVENKLKYTIKKKQ